MSEPTDSSRGLFPEQDEDGTWNADPHYLAHLLYDPADPGTLVDWYNGTSYSLGGGDGGGSARPPEEQPNLHIELSELADTEYIDQPIRIPDGKTLNLYAWGCRNDAAGTPTGLEVQLIDVSDGTTIANANTAWAEGTPIASVAGPADVFFRLENATGATEIAGATGAYLLE